MALPLNTAPIFTLKVPSTDKLIRYRPFLVKDEKALMIAQQSEDTSVMVETLKGVIKSCVVDEINVDELATFDIEYTFTQIRGKSVGETIELLLDCDEDHGEELNKKAKSKVVVDLSQIKVSRPEGHTNKIKLFGDVGVIMKYPTVNTTKELEKDANDVDSIFNVIVDSIEVIYQGEDLYYAKEQSKEELLQFLNNLSAEQFGRIQKFFETMPKVSIDIEYTCPVCGKHHNRLLEGLTNFFS